MFRLLVLTIVVGKVCIVLSLGKPNNVTGVTSQHQIDTNNTNRDNDNKLALLNERKINAENKELIKQQMRYIIVALMMKRIDSSFTVEMVTTFLSKNSKKIKRLLNTEMEAIGLLNKYFEDNKVFDGFKYLPLALSIHNIVQPNTKKQSSFRTKQNKLQYPAGYWYLNRDMVERLKLKDWGKVDNVVQDRVVTTRIITEYFKNKYAQPYKSWSLVLADFLAGGIKISIEDLLNYNNTLSYFKIYQYLTPDIRNKYFIFLTTYFYINVFNNTSYKFSSDPFVKDLLAK